MKRLLTVTLSLLLAGVSVAQPDINAAGMGQNPQEEQPVAQFAPGTLTQDTPANATRYFLGALLSNYNQELNMTMAVAGAPIGYYGSDELMKAWSETDPLTILKNLKVDAVNVDTQTEEKATVTVTAHTEYRNGNGRGIERGQPQQYKIQLHFDRDMSASGFKGLKSAWRVVPLSSEEVFAKPLYQLPLLSLAATSALRDMRLLPVLQQQNGLNRLKWLGLGMLQFIQDYDEILVLDDAAHERAVIPYIKNKSVFIIPGSQEEKWHFNDNLSRKLLADIKIEDAPNVALFYDGSAPDSEHLNFRFNDKTLVCFLDGHVAALGKDELQKVIWKP